MLFLCFTLFTTFFLHLIYFFDQMGPSFTVFGVVSIETLPLCAGINFFFCFFDFKSVNFNVWPSFHL
uniref:Uncharacterized protein n=1 Tax=Rhizophora mucronata TaxID=61149 RepID=A0A2P2IY87_RHIMU